MVKKKYVPDRGDIVWIDLDPQTGHEQRGERPALVLSPAAYNGRVGMAVCCPITSQVKGYPFEVALPPGAKVRGVVLADHVKNLDWQARRARLAERAASEVMDDVVAKLWALVGPDQ